ncbi:MAG: hypothetical protein CBC49_001510, partial [Alphaproteobacteria bacterium TMED89]
SLPGMGSVRAQLLSDLAPVATIDGTVVEATPSQTLYITQGTAPRLSEQVDLQSYELAQASDGSSSEVGEAVAVGLSVSPGAMALLGMLMTSDQPEDGETSDATKNPPTIRRLSDEIFIEEPFAYTEILGTVYFEGYTETDYTWRYDGNLDPEIVSSGSSLFRFSFGPSFNPRPAVVEFDEAAYFAGSDTTVTESDLELWKYDGTTATMVNGPNGIDPSNGSNPSQLTVFDGALYFEASDGTDGFELWKYDGTTATMVNGPNGIDPSGSSNPSELTVFDGALYFEASDGTNGYELWKYDGTTATMVNGPNGLNPSGDSSPYDLTVFDGALYFEANDGTNGDELWKYDGSTLELIDIIEGADSSEPSFFSVANERLYFVAEVADKDGDSVSDTSVLSYDPVNGLLDLLPAGAAPTTGKRVFWAAIELSENVYFEAEDEAHGSELWVTDGTTAGTTVIDTIPGTDGLEPNYMTSTSHGIIFTSEYGSDPAPWIIEVI